MQIFSKHLLFETLRREARNIASSKANAPFPVQIHKFLYIFEKIKIWFVLWCIVFAGCAEHLPGRWQVEKHQILFTQLIISKIVLVISPETRSPSKIKTEIEIIFYLIFKESLLQNSFELFTLFQ